MFYIWFLALLLCPYFFPEITWDRPAFGGRIAGLQGPGLTLDLWLSGIAHSVSVCSTTQIFSIMFFFFFFSQEESEENYLAWVIFCLFLLCLFFCGENKDERGVRYGVSHSFGLFSYDMIECNRLNQSEQKVNTGSFSSWISSRERFRVRSRLLNECTTIKHNAVPWLTSECQWAFTVWLLNFFLKLFSCLQVCCTLWARLPLFTPYSTLP